MKQRLLVPFLMLVSFMVAAQSARALEVPPLKAHVNDYAGMLSRQTVQQLEGELTEFEKSDSTQIVVLTIPSLEGESLEEFSIKVAEAWKVGWKGVDNGVILLVVKNDRAVGVAHGAEVHDADLVVSCADGHATIFDMLGGAYLSAEQREAYRSMPTFPSLLYVGLGIARNMSGEPTMKLFPLKEPMVLEEGALKVSTLSVRFFNFDPTTAPPGKTAAIVMISTRNHEYWTRLRREDPACYKKQKELVGERVVDALEAEVGGIREAVEVVDVSTPATWIRYTGNWKGSYEGFLPTRKTMMKNLGFTLPGLDRFYMNGQWVSVGGGLPPAAMNGRALAKRICKEFGRKFEALV